MIFSDVAGQWLHLCAGLFCGIAGGIYYEFFNAARTILKAGYVLGFALDFLFMLATSATLFAVAYRINGFDIRWYMLLGFFVGFCLERACFAKPVAFAAGKVYNILKKAKAALLKSIRRAKNDGETADIQG